MHATTKRHVRVLDESKRHATTNSELNETTSQHDESNILCTIWLHVQDTDVLLNFWEFNLVQLCNEQSKAFYCKVFMAFKHNSIKYIWIGKHYISQFPNSIQSFNKLINFCIYRIDIGLFEKTWELSACGLVLKFVYCLINEQECFIGFYDLQVYWTASKTIF